MEQRTSEFGIRIALGASRFNIFAEVVRQGMGPAVIGALTGVAACLPATRVIEHLLFKTERLDLLTFVVGLLVLIGSALMACYLPARRAMRVDPMVALRHE